MICYLLGVSLVSHVVGIMLCLLLLFLLICCFFFCFCYFLFCFFFFFSSRRRHTRSTRDWSSDVCSSDLGGGLRLRPPDAGPWPLRRVTFSLAGLDGLQARLHGPGPRAEGAELPGQGHRRLSRLGLLHR